MSYSKENHRLWRGSTSVLAGGETGSARILSLEQTTTGGEKKGIAASGWAVKNSGLETLALSPMFSPC